MTRRDVEQLRAAGELFTMPLRDEPWPVGEPPLPCPVCGRYWQPGTGSLLPCHTRCLWTETGALAMFLDARTNAQLARDLEISIATVRAGRMFGLAVARDGAGR